MPHFAAALQDMTNMIMEGDDSERRPQRLTERAKFARDEAEAASIRRQARQTSNGRKNSKATARQKGQCTDAPKPSQRRNTRSTRAVVSESEEDEGTSEPEDTIATRPKGRQLPCPDEAEDEDENEDEDEDEDVHGTVDRGEPGGDGWGYSSHIRSQPIVTEEDLTAPSKLGRMSRTRAALLQAGITEEPRGYSRPPTPPTSAANATANSLGMSSKAVAIAHVSPPSDRSPMVPPVASRPLKRIRELPSADDALLAGSHRPSKIAKPRSAAYDDEVERLITKSCEIYRVNMLVLGPYATPTKQTALQIESWNEARSLCGAKYEISTNILRILNQKTSHLTNEFKMAARNGVLHQKLENMGQADDGTPFATSIIARPESETENANLAAFLRERFRYTFLDPANRIGAYQSRMVSHVIFECLFRNKESLGLRYPEHFKPMPCQVIAFAATAVEHAIKEWSTGLFCSADFTQTSAVTTYEANIEQLKRFQKVNAPALAALQEKLYVEGCYRAGVMGATTELVTENMADEDFMH
ncbi:hypothetical protein CALVIDRAFT_567743 [Calocera viscosa TUFC12733]|uniref:DUF6532 domain-containing protein n=1 Tax=Calocera viscosa (strain TUFC12733) TaxID=1330018 RepID=A0A167HUP3_CALVF|nr:hypothetical protein CALVIDRAFT_567743 [Calocera viscosa TUFC12733]